MNAIWRRLPVVVRAILGGALAASAGTLPWALLVAGNQEFLSAVPWSVPLMAMYLWALWRYASRTNLRANRVPPDVWAAALVAGFLGLWALVGFMGTLNRLVSLPVQQTGHVSRFPFTTLLLLVLMGSVVAGVVEEASFRGYMQSPIERRHGPVAAILITGILFGVAHFTHPGVGLILMPYYVTVAAIYGSVAYLTNSIFPGMVLHAGGDVLSGSDLLLRGHSEWQSSSGPSASIWQTGIDAPFLVSFAVTVVVGAAAVWAYHSLAAMTRHNRERRFTGAGKVNSIGSDAPF